VSFIETITLIKGVFMSDSFWSEIKVEISVEQGEVIAEIFQEEGAGGVVYEDPDILAKNPCKDDEYLGTEAYQAVPEKYAIKAYFPVDDLLGERLVRLKERMSRILGYVPDFTLTQVQEEDWAEAWKAYFKPERIGKVVIKPSWEEYTPESGEVVVELNPGMAFGTGTHPTTRLCIMMLQEISSGQRDMLDIGTGSGILGLVAAKLGLPKVLGTDIDPMAVRVAAENIRRNQLEANIRVMEGDLLEINPERKFQLVVANIITAAILTIIPGLNKVLEPGGLFLASGIIEERSQEVISAFDKHGLTLVKTYSEQGWVGLLAKNTGGGS
jgi:ribosomal protein L11 methyltransferase